MISTRSNFWGNFFNEMWKFLDARRNTEVKTSSHANVLSQVGIAPFLFCSYTDGRTRLMYLGSGSAGRGG